MKFLKDLPIYLNGLAVGVLFWHNEDISIIHVVAFILAMITFYLYGENKTKNTKND